MLEKLRGEFFISKNIFITCLIVEEQKWAWKLWGGSDYFGEGNQEGLH